MNCLTPEYAAIDSKRRAAKRLGVTLDDYLYRTDHGEAWCRRHKGWVRRSALRGGGASANSGICHTCAEAGR